MSKYDAIIALPHWEPTTRKRMPLVERAGQFAPFAALSGHGDAIRNSEKEWEMSQGESPEDAPIPINNDRKIPRF